MKIACFTDSYLPSVNGVSFSVDGFAELMAEKGAEIEIYAPMYESTANTEQKPGKTVRRYYSVPFPTYKEWRFALPDVVKIYGQLEEFNPDVVHIHSPGSLGLTGILVAKMLKKPIVGTYHTLISEVLVYASLRKSLSRYLQAIDRVMNGVGVDLNLLSEKEKSRQETAGDSIPQRVTWSLVNRVYGRCDIVISPSEAIKRELSKRGLAKRIEVVSNGVDLDRFARKSDFAPTGRIIHTGRLGFEKNLRVVLTAFAEIAGKNPGYELIIAGDGPARKELEKMSKDLGVDNRVKFLGMIKRDDLPQIYRSGDVFATASTMETQGMVVLEAMACGLPVVGVRKYALPDLIKDGVNGFVVKPGGEKQMAGKLEYILNNPRLIRKMGMKAVETARKHDIRLMAEKLSGVYAEAMLIKFNGGTKKI